MANWEVKPLSEVCKIKPPKSEARAKLAEDEEVSFVPMEDLGIGVKYLQAKNTRLFGEVSGSYTYFADGDVLLAKITPCFENGKLGIARGLTNGVGFGSSEFIVLRPMPELDAEFLYYYLARPTFLEEGVKTMTGAVGHKRVAKDFIESYTIPLPSRSEQRDIVAILDEAFAAIATSKANIESSLKSAKELYAGQMQALFNQEDCWERVKLEDLLERGWITSHLDGNHGSDYPRKDEFVDAGVPYIAASAIKGGIVDFDEAKYLSHQRAASIRKGLAKNRDVLFAHNATVGPVAILNTDEEFVILGTSLTYYRCNPRFIHPEYLAHFMLSPAFSSQYVQVMKQSTRNQVPITKQREFFHVIPPIEVQKRIAKALDELATQIDRYAEVAASKLVALDELTKSLLHQAFTAQLTVTKRVQGAQIPTLQTETPKCAANVIAIAYARHVRQQREKTFGRVKEQKILHLVESIANVNLGRKPMKDAAGPNDFQHMLRAEQWAKEHSFFEMVDRGQGYDFKPLKDFDKHLSRARDELGPYLQRIEEVIDILVPMDSQDAEVFATVHAAWNNLLMDGVEATESAILKEARDSWHPDKLSIPEHKFKKAIELVRRKNLIPDGTGKYVTGQRALL